MIGSRAASTRSTLGKGRYERGVQIAGISHSREPYPTNVSSEEWAFVIPYYLAMLPPDAVQRRHDLRGGVQRLAMEVVERDFACTARFRCLGRDYEWPPLTCRALHYVVFACLMLHQAASSSGIHDAL